MKLYISLVLIIVCLIGGGYNGVKMLFAPETVNPYKTAQFNFWITRIWGLGIFLGSFFLLFQNTFWWGTILLFLCSLLTIFVYWHIGDKSGALLEIALCCIPLVIWYLGYPKQLLPTFFH